MPDTTRRRAMALMAAAAGAGLWPSRTTAEDGDDIAAVPSLGDLAARNGLLFGTAFDVGSIDRDREARLYRHHARILTSDGSMKFWSLRPEEDVVRYANADRLLAWANEGGIPLRGHCLIWNDWNPPWVAKLSAARRAYWLDRHVEETVGRYAGKLHSWDVVNEPFWPEHGKPGGFRDGPWLDAMGPDYIVRAMKRARAADPTARIVLNESGPEWENPFGSPTGPAPYRDGLLALIDRIQDAGVGLDAVGLQCHWFSDFRFDPGAFGAYLHELASRVGEIYLTEVDINDGAFAGSFEERDDAVAGRYETLLTAALAQPAVTVIITWQMADAASWMVQDPYHWAVPGRPPRPLPFDDQFRPKAAYHTLARLLSDPPRE